MTESVLFWQSRGSSSTSNQSKTVLGHHCEVSVFHGMLHYTLPPSFISLIFLFFVTIEEILVASEPLWHFRLGCHIHSLSFWWLFLRCNFHWSVWMLVWTVTALRTRLTGKVTAACSLTSILMYIFGGWCFINELYGLTHHAQTSVIDWTAKRKFFSYNFLCWILHAVDVRQPIRWLYWWSPVFLLLLMVWDKLLDLRT